MTELHPLPSPLEGDLQHGHLLTSMEQTQSFFAEDNRAAIRNIVEEVNEVRSLAGNIPGFLGCYGVGYPFYALDNTNDIALRVPAVDTYVDDAIDRISTSKETVGNPWPCATCQESQQLVDLKTKCKPCDRVLFKPRDLFKALPDIDVVTVFDQPTIDTENILQNALAENNLLQSDTNIRRTYINTMEALKGSRDHKLPLDAHIWSFDKVEECCTAIRESPDDIQNHIVSRSLHGTWENHSLNFWFDFVFSLTEVGESDTRLKEVIDVTRSSLVESLGEEKIIDLIGEVSVRGAAILEDPALQEVFVERIASWRNL